MYFYQAAYPVPPSINPGGEKTAAEITPLMDIVDQVQEIKFIFTVPGISPDNLNVEVEENTLHIESSEQGHANYSNYLYQESWPGNYFRSTTLPTYVDVENPRATFDNGLLEISFPKKSGNPVTEKHEETGITSQKDMPEKIEDSDNY